jgi:hypothetical protein
MSPEQILEIIRIAAPTLVFVVGISIAGAIYHTRIKIKNGYPLSGAWGQAVYPKTSTEDGERIKLLSQENAQLRAELGSVKDRLANVERIVTDSGYQLTSQIEALRITETKGEA